MSHFNGLIFQDIVEQLESVAHPTKKPENAFSQWQEILAICTAD